MNDRNRNFILFCPRSIDIVDNIRGVGIFQRKLKVCTVSSWTRISNQTSHERSIGAWCVVSNVTATNAPKASPLANKGKYFFYNVIPIWVASPKGRDALSASHRRCFTLGVRYDAEHHLYGARHREVWRAVESRQRAKASRRVGRPSERSESVSQRGRRSRVSIYGWISPPRSIFGITFFLKRYKPSLFLIL